MGTATRKLGWEDYLQSPDDGNRHEIVDGEWVVTPPPAWKHQRAISRIHLKIALFLEDRHDLEVFLSPCAVAIGGPNFVEPDLFVVTHDGSVAFEEVRIAGAPVLTIEVLSPSTRRYDPEAGFGPPVKTFADAGGRVESRVLAGLELAVAEVFLRRGVETARE